MNKKRIYGVVLAVVGIIMLFTAQYIYKQVLEGKGQISQAQERVNQSNALFSLSPYSHQVGKELTNSAQSQISEGQKKVQFYEQVASLMYVGGIVVIVIGLGVVGFSYLKKK